MDGLDLLLARVVEEALATLAPQVALLDKLVQHRQVAALHANAEELGRRTLEVLDDLVRVRVRVRG